MSSMDGAVAHISGSAREYRVSEWVVKPRLLSRVERYAYLTNLISQSSFRIKNQILLW